jgi:uncharacterized RDD family membrane protein YckC
MKYATFWQRAIAAVIDAFILLPIIILYEGLKSITKSIVVAILIAVIYPAYRIFCHGRFGQTLGKRIVGIRVVRTTEEPLGWSHAWLRSSVEVLFSLLTVIASCIALTTMGDAEYYNVVWTQRTRNLHAYLPFWFSWVETMAHIWFWSQIIVMLFNERRRTLHDFIADTVVINNGRLTNGNSR